MVRLDGGGRWLSPAQAVLQFEEFAKAGVDQVIVNMPNVEVPETLDFLASRGVPQVHKLDVAR
jgi:hypothetical protein